MCVIQSIRDILVHGVSVFRSAFRGQFNEESDAVKKIKEDLDSDLSGKEKDRMNLRQDRKMVHGDFSRSFNNVILSNG